VSAYTDADVQTATAALAEAPLGCSEEQDMRLVLDLVAPAIAARAWDEGHRTPWQRECSCGKYGTGQLITPNPYRADEIEAKP
jgi:hypothetical protein